MSASNGSVQRIRVRWGGDLWCWRFSVCACVVVVVLVVVVVKRLFYSSALSGGELG